MSLPNYPTTRKETYLAKIAGQNTTLPEYPTTREEEYLDYIAKHGGGGGGGTTDYTDLDNKPKINSVELKGNKSLTDLGIASTTDLATKISGKQVSSTVSGDSVTFTDAALTATSIIDGPYVGGMVMGIDSVIPGTGTVTFTFTSADADGETAYIWIR